MSAVPTVEVRNAEADDAPALAALGARLFTETFGHNYPPDDLALFLAEAHSVDAQTAAIMQEKRAIRLAFAGNALVAYSDTGPMGLPFPAAEPGARELKRLYVDRAFQGGGLARQLMAEVIGAARTSGAPALYLGVWSLNPRARAFYRRAGFEDVGAYQFRVGATLDDEIIMRLAL